MIINESNNEPWRVTLVDTCNDSCTGGRLKRVISYVSEDDLFCFTYGDGLSDVNINSMIAFHIGHGNLATDSATRPIPQFGIMRLDDEFLSSFNEKPQDRSNWINGGFFVLSLKIDKFIDREETYWEHDPMRNLVKKKQLRAFRHDGFR